MAKMSEADVFLERDTQFFVFTFLGRILTYSGFAVISIFTSKIAIVCYGTAWFVMPNILSNIFWAYQVYFIWRLDDVQKLRRVLILALGGALPWDRVLFGLIHTGLPLIAYLFSAAIVNCVLQSPSILWTVGWKSFKVILFILIIASLATWIWRSVHHSIRETTKRALLPFWRTIGKIPVTLMSNFSLFCRGRGYFLIFWWRIWERRADRQFHRNLERIQSQKWLEDTRDGKSERSPFRYRPLQKEREIRLLEISMGEFRNIKAKMVHVDVDNPGEYFAISYTWGGDKKSHGIVIDEDWMATTVSVYEVIFKQAPISGTKRLWLDFVCINQDDKQERASQVCLMREIYSSAEKVIACLSNPDDEIVDVTEHYLHKIYADREKLLKQTRMSRMLSQQRKLFFRIRNPQWAAMSTLLKHRYWTRVWVIQEIANAKKLDILYGDRELSLDALQHLAVSTISSPENDPFVDLPELLYQEGENPLLGLDRINLMMAIRGAVQGDLPLPKTLEDVLPLSTRFNATDQRDRVFALQGVLTENVDKELLPNYTIEVEELFKRVAHHFLDQKDPFWMFAYAGISQPRKLTSLPSWVPDWSTLRWLSSIDPLIGGSNEIKEPLEQEATRSKAQSFTIANEILQLEGIALGSILATASIPMTENVPNFMSGNFDKSILEKSSQSLSHLQATVKHAISDPYINGEARDDALWRMLLGYTATDEKAIVEARRLFTAWEKTMKMPLDIFTKMEHDTKRIQEGNGFLGRVKAMRKFGDTISEYFTASNFVNANISNTMGTRCTGRVVAVTDSGYMALVPKGTKSNDEIYLLTGARAPHVIRNDSFLASLPTMSSTSRGSGFRLVGDAYVHGLAVDDARITGGALQKIELY